MALLALAQTAAAGAAPLPAPGGPASFALPSGAEARFLDRIEDVPGPAGITWRYRFVVPSLGDMVPVAVGDGTGEITAEDVAELDSLGIDVSTGPGPDTPGADAFAEAELVSPEELGLTDPAPVEVGGDAAAETAIDQGFAVPADPDLLLQDPLHEDIVWLCEQWVLPQLAPGASPPSQIIISVADRVTVFGEVNMQAVQLFEGFSVAPDRRHCIWEPW